MTFKSYQTFNQCHQDILQSPMFLGDTVNVARYDQQKYPFFDHLTQKQLSFFWRPEEIDLSRDRIDFHNLSEAERHIFIANIQYQTLLDSIQGRSPNIAFLPIASLPELETWIETWSFSETIHSRSYTHILRSLFDNPSPIFDEIATHGEISKRAGDISYYYDDLIQQIHLANTMGYGTHHTAHGSKTISEYSLKKALYLTLHAVNALEAIRFYVSFACTFAFSEQKKLEGCGKIMKLIARDEALHLSGTRKMIQIIHQGDDPLLLDIAIHSQNEAKEIFMRAVSQEKEWANYLFSHGSILGLNATILSEYIDYLAYQRMKSVSLNVNDLRNHHHPIPWIRSYLHSDNVQVAPQEVEVSSYLSGQINSDIALNAFSNIELD